MCCTAHNSSWEYSCRSTVAQRMEPLSPFCFAPKSIPLPMRPQCTRKEKSDISTFKHHSSPNLSSMHRGSNKPYLYTAATMQFVLILELPFSWSRHAAGSNSWTFSTVTCTVSVYTKSSRISMVEAVRPWISTQGLSFSESCKLKGRHSFIFH